MEQPKQVRHPVNTNYSPTTKPRRREDKNATIALFLIDIKSFPFITPQ